MRPSEPCVIGDTRLLWRHGVGTVDLRQILGEHHPALQFLGTGIGALREIDNGTLLPPAVPVAKGLLVVLVVFKARGDRTVAVGRLIGEWRDRDVLSRECEDVVSGGENEVVTVAFCDGCIAFPLHHYLVFRVVKRPLDDGRVVILRENDRLVKRGLRPVIAVVGMLPGRVGEPKGHGSPPV